MVIRQGGTMIKYIDVIINRWEQFTGQQAELIEEVDNGN